MKQLMLNQSFARRLRGLYEVESKLCAPISHIIQSTERQSLKAELVVYLTRLRENIRQIEHIFYLLQDRPSFRIERNQIELLIDSSFLETELPCEDRIDDLILSLQDIIQYKMFLYKDVYTLATRLDQHQVASILHEILHFEEETNMILKEFSPRPFKCVA